MNTAEETYNKELEREILFGQNNMQKWDELLKQTEKMPRQFRRKAVKKIQAEAKKHLRS